MPTEIKIPRLSPSAMPHLSLCMCFEQHRMSPTDKMLRGTWMDSAFRRALLQPTMSADELLATHPELTMQDVEDVLWAKDEVVKMADGRPVVSAKRECRFAFLSKYGAKISGEMDAYWRGGVMDLKSGNKHPYRVQLLPYACHLFRTYPELEVVDANLVYCSLREVDKGNFTREDALLRMEAFVKAWTNPNKKPTPCDACKYCRNRMLTGGCGLLI